MTQKKTPLYRISKLEHWYNADFMLKIPLLEVDTGSCLGISGPNGCGKSTLLRILAFLEYSKKGKILYNGIKVNPGNNLNKNITFLPQSPYLLKRSVLNNVTYGLKLRNDKNIIEKASLVLQSLGLPIEKFGKRKWYELSGGEAQRVALASRLVLNPDVLILDEPVSNIDKESSILIKDLISKIHKTLQTTIIITSHDLIWLNDVADEILRFQHGRIVGSGNDNVITGPWKSDKNGLWAKILPDGKKILSSKPPEKNSIAILSPSEIIIAEKKQSNISAQNMLKGEIINMSSAYNGGKILLDLKVHGTVLTVNITQRSAVKLKLHPGKKVWLIFKATSFHWQ